MLSRIFLVVAAAALAGAAAVEEPGADREGKFNYGHLFHIVTFDNGPCHAKNGEHGTCFSQKECDGLGGTNSGTCANGFGVCCILTATCDQTISVNNTYFINSDVSTSSGAYGRAYPTASTGHYATTGSCHVTLEPPYGTCQILLQFEDFELAPPVEGDCTNDSLTIHGANPGSNIPVLCGSNTGQHMYIDVDNSEGPFKIWITMSTLVYQRRWKIKVSFIEVHNPCKAPARCLQYYKETSGSFSSFNYHGTPPMMLNNQKYSICFAYVPGFCDIGMSFNRFDLGNVNGECGGDLFGFNCEKICGDMTHFTTTLNATGPAVATVFSDDDNNREEEGFYATYMMMACH